MQKAVVRCVSAGMTALLSTAAEPTPENEQILSECFSNYFGNKTVARELSKFLRGKEPDLEELVYLFEEEAEYDRNNLPGLSFETGMTAFLAAFMESAVMETELNRVIRAGQLIEQTGIQRKLLGEMRELVAFLRKENQRVTGIQANQIQAENVVSGVQHIHYLSAPRDDGGGQNHTEIRHYLKTLVERCDALDLAAIDETCSTDDVIRVSDVFTSLNLKTLRFPDQSVADAVCGKSKKDFQREKDRGEAVPVQAVEAVGDMHRLVILGQPGGGKTTLVNFIGSRLALRRLKGDPSAGFSEDRLDESTDDLAGFDTDDAPLPVRIILRHFAAWIPAGSKKGTAGMVWNYLEHMLNENWGCQCYEALRQMLLNEGGIVFFDGLDEVREKDEDAKRSIIKEAVEDFAKIDKCRIIVTCREYAYSRSDDWRLSEKMFPVTELALFNMDQIRMFANTWYKVLGPQKEWNEAKQNAEAENLVNAVDALAHLKELAQYPLLMTLMAQVHGRDGYLPKDRADLYKRAVNLLLEHWDNRIVRDEQGVCKRQSGLILRLGIQRDTLLSVLQELAFSAHERQEMETDRSEKCADISKLDLLEALKAELKSYDSANEVLEYIHERSGLLTTQDNRTYTFPHRTFQEYLTATHLMKQSEFDSMLAERVHRDVNWWREVFLLAAGHVKDVPRNILNMVDVLLPKRSNGMVKTNQAQYARLAAQALVETDFLGHVKKEKGSDRFLRIYEEIQSWLVDALASNTTLKPLNRAKSGRMLALLGDPRKEVITIQHMKFCLVPAGNFYMGDKNRCHLNDSLNFDYWIALHPVSNAQYDKFVKAGGYAQEKFWVETAEAGYWKSDKLKSQYDSEWRSKPYEFSAPFYYPNHPVVGVSWYEALAFTRWLTNKWKENGTLDEGWEIRLPSEAEWEKAARGGVEIIENPLLITAENFLGQSDSTSKTNPNNVRKYPWGDKIGENIANYRDTGISSTSAMGCFASGVSPYGCLDMVGNVREWTRSLWGKNIGKADFDFPYEPDDGRENFSPNNKVLRILRGGAFYLESDYLRCSCRSRYTPDYRNAYTGFRFVCAPVTSDRTADNHDKE